MKHYDIKLRTNTTEVFPQLDELLKSLTMKEPSLTFIQNTLVSPCTSVDVYNHVDKVGELGYFSKTNRNGDGYRYFSIKSPKILKNRRPYNCIDTKNNKTALREAVKYFSQEVDKSKVCAFILEKVKTNLSEITSRAKYRSELNTATTKVITEYFYQRIAFGVVPEVPASILDTFNSKDLVSKRRDYVIVEAMEQALQRREGYALRFDIDGGFTVVSAKDGSLLYRGSSSYDLPEWMQSKLAMLKVMDENRAIHNVGVKFEPDNDYTYMYFVEGDIPDMI